MRRVVMMGALLVALTWPGVGTAQQVADTAFAPPIPRPAFAVGEGPLLLIDEAHHNFHTSTGRYLPFAALARRDGFRVQGSATPFTAESLREARVLVIANALNARNREDWTQPTPSAFTDVEIAAVRAWVLAGGSLWLIADHMPMAGAAEALGAALGVTWSNGFAMDGGKPSGPFEFTHDGAQRLGRHAVTEGRSEAERVSTIATFTGSAFRLGTSKPAGEGGIPADATPILTLKPGVISLVPQTAWQFGPDTKREDVGGWSQGAVFDLGKGRVAVFGEAAMFTAQLAGAQKQPMGMNAPIAAQNAQFLLNLLHWLARVI